MRLLLIADVFPPVRTSAAVLTRDLARALIRLGHYCTVLTPDSQLQAPFSLNSEDSIPVLRIKSAPLKRINLVQRAINEMMLSWRMWTGYRQSPLARESWDGVAFYSPTIFFGRFVARLRNKHGIPACLVLRDVFPDWAVDLGLMRKGPHYWIFRFFAQYQYSIADVIAIESPSNRRYFVGTKRHVELLPNWIDMDSAFSVDPANSTAQDSAKVIVYAGNIGVAQDMDNVLRLARNLMPREDCRILLVGDGTDRRRIESAVAEQRLSNIQFHPEVSPEQLRTILRRCTIGLISLDRRLRSHNIPGKLLTYLEAGLPVLASVNAGNDLKSVVEGSGAGRVVWNGDDHAFFAAATSLLDDGAERKQMSEAARDLCRREFSSGAAAERIVGFLRSST